MVFFDSGIQVDHPEFQDVNGVSRVQQIDWYAESGVPGTMPVDHYTDTNGHGTHVAGIAAGKKFGWAKNAHIYSLKVFGGPSLIDMSEVFDLVIGWHNAKKAAGNNRPTVVNMSITYNDYFVNMSATENAHSYRGIPWTGTTKDVSKGMMGGFYNLGVYSFGYRVGYADVGLQEMIDAGIHAVKSSGNNSQKIDVIGGLDYDNYFTSNAFGGVIVYYNRGSSPYDNEALIVGGLDYIPYNESLDYMSSTSDAGPAVNLFAPARYVMSSCSQTNVMNGAPYQYDANYKQVLMSGSSMATGQVSGMAALLLQMEPTCTPAQLKSKVLNMCTNAIWSTGLDDDYGVHRSLKGAPQAVAYMRYNDNVSYTIKGMPLIVG